MTWEQLLIAAVLALPQPWYRTPVETSDDRALRVAMVASSALRVTANPEGWDGWTAQQRAALLLTVTWYESRRWAIEVHDGRKRGDTGRAICLAQVQNGPWTDRSREDWESLAGTAPEATERCLAEGWRWLSHWRERCGADAARIMNGYGTGRGCTPGRWAKQRAIVWARLAEAK